MQAKLLPHTESRSVFSHGNFQRSFNIFLEYLQHDTVSSLLEFFLKFVLRSVDFQERLNGAFLGKDSVEQVNVGFVLVDLF